MLRMRRTRAYLLIGLSITLLLAVHPAAQPADVVKPGMKRCAVLQSQLTSAEKAKHVVFSTRAKSLEAEAQQFCSKGKTAQGARTYVKALNSLGIKPELETEHVTGDNQ